MRVFHPGGESRKIIMVVMIMGKEMAKNGKTA